MDNVTHGAIGILTGWSRKGGDDPVTARAVPWAAFMAAEAPDLDVFIRRIPGLGWVGHRGITHTLAALPFTALAVALVCKLLFPRARFHVLFIWAAASMFLAHLVADVITYSGIRPFLPWSAYRASYEIMPFIDLNLSLPLVLAVLLGWWKPQWRRKLAVGVGAGALLYLGARAGAYATVREVSSQAQAVPVGHRVVSREDGGFRVREVRFWAPWQVTERSLPPVDPDPAMLRAAQALRPANRFLQPRTPYYLIEARGALRRITVVDLTGRFAIGYPWAEVDGDGQILRRGRTWFIRW